MSQPNKPAPTWIWSGAIRAHYYIDEVTNELVTEDGKRRPNPNIPRAVRAETNNLPVSSGGPGPSARSEQRPIPSSSRPPAESQYSYDRPDSQIPTTISRSKPYPEVSGLPGSSRKPNALDAARMPSSLPAGSKPEQVSRQPIAPGVGSGVPRDPLTEDQRKAAKTHGPVAHPGESSKKRVGSGKGSDSGPSSSVSPQYQELFTRARKKAIDTGRSSAEAEAIAKDWLAQKFGEMAVTAQREPVNNDRSTAYAQPAQQPPNQQQPAQQPANQQQPAQQPPNQQQQQQQVPSRPDYSSPMEVAIRTLMARGYPRSDAKAMLEAQLRSRRS